MTLENWTLARTTPADSLGTTDYLESKESGKEAFSPGASTANRTFYVSWMVRADFLDDCLGYSYLNGDNEIVRVLPDPHPHIENFFAEDATVEGMGQLDITAQDTPDWTIAKINVNYKPRPYRVISDEDLDEDNLTEQDRYTSKVFTFNADYLTLNGGMKFVTSGEVLANPPGRITTALGIDYCWHEIPALSEDPFLVPNLDKIVDCLGRVNSAVFDPNGLAAPIGTILFVGVEPKMITPRLGDEGFLWELQFKFLYRNNGTGISSETAGHNYIYDVKNDRWDLVTHDGTSGGNRIYPETDLNDLWTID